MKKFNLGHKISEKVMPDAAPEVPEDRTYYPSIYISDAPPELFKIPDSGEATITFKVVSRSMSKREDKSSCSLELELHSITPKGNSTGSMGESKDESGDAIDEYLTGKS